MDAPAQSPTAREARPHSRGALASASWRFSIRELLLLTTAVAALVALFLSYYQKSQPFAQSLLCREFGTSDHIRAVAAPLVSQPADQPIVNGGGGGGSNERSGNVEYSYSVRIPRSLRGRFMWQLNQEAQRMLKQDRPQYSRGSMQWGNSDDLRGFSYSYEGGPSQGNIHVRRVDVTEELMELAIFIDEHANR